ncbi:hypothetical protein T484DRAFT_1832001, partial [Baffinella frigidus]
AALPTITLEKFPLSYSSLNVTLLASDGTAYPCTVQHVTRIADLDGQSGLAQLTVLAPTTPAALGDVDGQIALGEYTLRIALVDSSLTIKAMAIDNFVVYDGFSPKVVSYGPEVVPTVASAGGRLLELRSKVTGIFANFPQGLSPATVVVTLGAEDVTVLQVRDLVTCAPSATDCNRTLLTLLAPALPSPGAKTISISAPGMSSPLAFGVTYEPPCDFQALCGARSQLVNYRALLDAPTVACDPAYCITVKDVSVPEILRVSPTEGLVVGGTLVTLQVAGLPAFSAADIKVVAGSGVTKAFGEVFTFTQEPGSSLASSKGLLVLRTPAVDALSEEVEFTVSTKVDSESRSVTFKFDYLPALSGATTFVLGETQQSMYETSVPDTVSLALSLSNVPRRTRPFIPTDIMVKVGGGEYRAVSKITSSDRDRTKVNVEIKEHAAVPSGTLEIRAYSASRGIATAGVHTLTVDASPAPSVVGAYPSDGSTDLSHSIAVTVQYVPPSFQLADLTAAQLVTAQGRTYPVEILSVANKKSKCLHTYCSLFEVKVRAPALDETDNGGGDASFSAHTAAGVMFSWAFKYVATGDPEVLGFSPKWQYVVSDAASPEASSRTVTIFLKNFPRPGCKDSLACKAEALRRQVMVRFSSDGDPVGVAPSSISETADGMLSIQVDAPAEAVIGEDSVTVDAPAKAVIGVDSVTVWAAAEGEYSTVETGVFAFASVVGGTLVTVKAYGISPIPAQSAVRVTIDDGSSETTLDSGNILTVTDNTQAGRVAEMTLVLAMPAGASAGVVTCRVKLGGGGQITDFLFEYFDPPVASSLEHGGATVKGQTAATDGASTAVRISNFPAIASGADVAVTFGAVPSPVLAFVNFKGGVWLQVRVPPAIDLAPGTVPLTIQHIGTPPTPRGGVTGHFYIHTRKVAAVDFTYYVPLPEVVSVRWCLACQAGRTCLVNARCANAAKPTENSAPLGGAGTLTVTMRNAPVLAYDPLSGALAPSGNNLFGVASVTASLGATAVASLVRVVFQDGDLSAFELSMPSAAAGDVIAEMSVMPAGGDVPSTAAFAFTFFDDAIALACVDGQSGLTSDGQIAGGLTIIECRAPSSAGAPFQVTLSNFLLSTALAAADQLTVTFGSEAALGVTILSSTAARTVLEITPPSYECAACAYAAGEAMVDLSVVSRTDASRGASSRFTFWSAPVVSAIAINPLGLLLAVTFSHATDRAGMDRKDQFDQSCARLFVSDAAFAKLSGITAAKCVWASAVTLNVLLGVGATLVPGDALTLLPSRVRSANLVSPYAPSVSTSVSAPAFLKEPSLSVSGPTTIDQCALLNLKASSDSPRPPDFAWRCLNHPGLDSALRAISTSQDVDFTYEISVTATDMFGSVSKEVVVKEVMFEVLKGAAAAPQLYFQPASVSVTRDQLVEVRAVTVRAVTMFSQCTSAKSEMLFQWTQGYRWGKCEMLFQWAQVSGPTEIPAEHLGAIAQLRIPPATLQADAAYVVALTVNNPQP